MFFPHPDSPLYRMEKSAESEFMSGRDNENTNHVAYVVFHGHYADLLIAIQDPEILACELFTESVVSSTVVEFANNMLHQRDVRTSKLLMAVESQILEEPGAFDMFLSVLAKRPLMSDLCGRMVNAYGKV